MRREGNDIVIEVPPGTLRAALFSAISGVRSMAGPALLARAVENGEVGRLRGTGFTLLGSGNVPALLQTLMVGEMGADKTPFIPSRTSAGPLFGRALSGALVGSALFASDKRRGAAGAALGALSALAGTFAADRLRGAATRTTGLPDPLFGLLEDGLVLFGGRRLLRGWDAPNGG